MFSITSLESILGPLKRDENSSLIYDTSGYVIPGSTDISVYAEWLIQREWWEGRIQQPVRC